MSPRILIAGIGNIFFSDDGFGVEVARRLSLQPPEGTRVTDFGIRGLHLAYALLDPLDLVVVVDALSRGGTAGTVYAIEPDLDAGLGATDPDAHGLSLPAVFASARAMGGALPRIIVVGCEPQEIGEGVGLSAPVQTAIEPAEALVRELVERERRSAAGRKRASVAQFA
ncbi:MAG: hydrogenase maturation protease [Myxococcaceae bacterium]